MKTIDPEKTEFALGNRRIDVRTVWRSFSNNPEMELRLAKAYWLQTIQPYIAGCKLYGAEFFVAAEAHFWLRAAAESAIHWNNSEAGKSSPISAVAILTMGKEEFREPEELCADENLKPEILAGIAASFVNQGEANMNPDEAVHKAHILLLAAKQYIGTLPQKQGTGSLKDCIELPYKSVTFAEILRSNEKDAGRLPLLPPVQQNRNGGRLTKNALKSAVKRFLEEHNPTKQHSPSVTQEDYEREEQEWELKAKQIENDKAVGKPSDPPFRVGNGKPLTYQEWQKQNRDSINEFLDNNHISYRIISMMRWERFKNHWQGQQSRTQKRKSFKSK